MVQYPRSLPHFSYLTDQGNISTPELNTTRCKGTSGWILSLTMRLLSQHLEQLLLKPTSPHDIASSGFLVHSTCFILVQPLILSTFICSHSLHPFTPSKYCMHPLYSSIVSHFFHPLLEMVIYLFMH